MRSRPWYIICHVSLVWKLAWSSSQSSVQSTEIRASQQDRVIGTLTATYDLTESFSPFFFSEEAGPCGHRKKNKKEEEEYEVKAVALKNFSITLLRAV